MCQAARDQPPQSLPPASTIAVSEDAAAPLAPVVERPPINAPAASKAATVALIRRLLIVASTFQTRLDASGWRRG